MFQEVNAQPVDLFWTRQTPERLIYLGNEPRPYGITESECWNMGVYMAAVLANGLRMLVAYGHLFRDKQEYEAIARKLELYSTDYDDVLYDNIDWSQDAEETDFLSWLNAKDRSPWPGMNEYVEKSEQIEYWQRVYMYEALDWLQEHWGELWD